jgi:dynein heavy chain
MMTTKYANPNYSPEVSTKTTIVNFAVKEQGLEEQLLGMIVAQENPDLDKQRNDLVVGIAKNKSEMLVCRYVLYPSFQY